MKHGRTAVILSFLATRNSRRLVYIVVCLALLPISLQANAGTSLMWATMLHLVLGNAVIGFAEGVLIARWFRADRRRCISTMILANYVSAWGGGLFTAQLFVSGFDIHLYNGLSWLWVTIGFTFLLTLALEWPFVIFCVKSLPGFFAKSARANLLVQSLSYIVLFIMYWAASEKTLYGEIEVAPPSAIATGEGVTVYFISKLDGNVYSIDLQGREPRQVYPLGSTNRNDRLAVRLETNSWDLLVRFGGENNKRTIVIATNLPGTVVEDWRTAKSGDVSDTWMNFGSVAKFRTNTHWNFSTGFWAAQGLRAHNTNSGERIEVKFETPFIQWYARNATQLPNDQVIFQFGDEQICVFDPKTRKLAMLVRGRGPVVALSAGMGMKKLGPPVLLSNQVPNKEEELSLTNEASASPKKYAKVRVLGSIDVAGVNCRVDLAVFNAPYVRFHFPETPGTESFEETSAASLMKPDGTRIAGTIEGFPSPIGERCIGFRLPLDPEQILEGTIILEVAKTKTEFQL